MSLDFGESIVRKTNDIRRKGDIELATVLLKSASPRGKAINASRYYLCSVSIVTNCRSVRGFPSA